MDANDEIQMKILFLIPRESEDGIYSSTPIMLTITTITITDTIITIMDMIITTILTPTIPTSLTQHTLQMSQESKRLVLSPVQMAKYRPMEKLKQSVNEFAMVKRIKSINGLSESPSVYQPMNSSLSSRHLPKLAPTRRRKLLKLTKKLQRLSSSTRQQLQRRKKRVRVTHTRKRKIRVRRRRIKRVKNRKR